MNNYIDMNDVEQLIIDKLTGQIGEEDDLRLEELIAQNQEVEQLWQQMAKVYAMRKAVSFDQSFNVEDAWQALQQKVNILQPVTEPVTDTVAIPIRSNTSNWWRYSIAAAVAGLVIISLYLFIDYNRNQVTAAKTIQIKLANGNIVHTTAQDSLAGWLRNARAANIDPGAWNTLTVPAGKNYAFQLADGSKVWMNALSDLRFPLLFTRPERVIELNGEAFFKVAHQASQPFSVQVNGLTVKALGTEFNIKSYNKEATYISLVTGSVLVENAKGESIILLPGEGVVASDRNSSLRKESFDEATVLGWMKGVYFFRNEKLHQISVVAERMLDINIQLKDPTLAGLHFTGAIDRNKPVSHFLNMLASSGDIRYEINKDKVIISRK
ncbi:MULTISPECIES: FecR domain-containing protein [Niastella]|uniref:FecR domain-containing protein n=1 Tax=Niastella soli TaxID=2821487 RepID=A0ABS3YZ04_9BACT|nr:FecR domain-containing protein [Niastella soli]MBO9203161.1 FecR domain-containing protein [Niastella soli]